MTNQPTKSRIDTGKWARRPHFEFFSRFEEPTYGICAKIDCTAAYRFAKMNGFSFFIYYLYQSLCAAQMIGPFKQRIEQNEVFQYEQVDAATTVARSDGTFGYGHVFYRDSLQDFAGGASQELERVRNASDLIPGSAQHVILYSTLPWIDFTALSHPRYSSVPDSRPRITFGKVTETAGRRSMPVSVHVHHALVDGLHVGQYLDRFQELMNAD